MRTGEQLLEFLTANSLCKPMCAEDPDHAIIVVWSSGAVEQLEAFLGGLVPKEELEKAYKEGWYQSCAAPIELEQSHVGSYSNQDWQHSRARRVMEGTKP